MKNLFLFFAISISHFSFSQNNDQKIILQILEEQEKSWNNGDLVHFMKGYWKNDSLVFIGKNGLTYGYNNTLSNYQKSYPDSSHMGKLHFQILDLKAIGKHYYFVIGQWKLTRSIGNLQGHFSLLFRKNKKGWKIIADHSS